MSAMDGISDELLSWGLLEALEPSSTRGPYVKEGRLKRILARLPVSAQSLAPWSASEAGIPTTQTKHHHQGPVLRGYLAPSVHPHLLILSP